jgi:L-ascorbate metabolism protein UlaG (beta-lactamase superfamily)
MSSVVITYLGHACFLLKYENSNMVIDPRSKSHSRIEGDIIYATHQHPDHVAGIDEFLKVNKPNGVLIGNEQVTKKYQKWGRQIITVKDGEELSHGVWKLKFIKGRHGVFRGELNLGILVKTPSFSFGHLGDSVSFEGFANEQVDFLAIPICGIFAASPTRAIKELEKFNTPLPTIIPMHWIWRNPKGFCRKLKKRFPNSNCIVPKKNESIHY